MARPQPTIVYIMDEDDIRIQGAACKDFKGEGYYWSYADQDGIWDATPRGPFRDNAKAYMDYVRGDSDE